MCKRLLRMDKPDVDRVMIAMRQFGCGVEGGAECLQALFQVVDDLWRAGKLPRPVARVQIDESNFFGSAYWDAIREESLDNLPNHAAAAAWKHAAPSFARQPDVPPTLKNRGAEQGDVDAPAEASLALGRVARNAKAQVHRQQRDGDLPWCQLPDQTEEAAISDFDQRAIRQADWCAVAPSKRRDPDSGGKVTQPADEIQAGGGIADFWYMDDENALMDPSLVSYYLNALDPINEAIGASRNMDKSIVTYYATPEEMQRNWTAWRLDDVSQHATIKSASGEVPVTLGVGTGSLEARAEQFHRRTDVVAKMLDRLPVCCDTQIELVLSRACLGVGKINHMLRASGAELSKIDGLLSRFDAVQDDALRRLCPGLDELGLRQAALGASVGGLGRRRATSIALPACLASAVLTTPKLATLAGAIDRAGLIPGHLIVDHYAARTGEIKDNFLGGLSSSDAAKALDFLNRVADAAQDRWASQCSGTLKAGSKAPRVDTESLEEGEAKISEEIRAAQNDGREDEERVDFGEQGSRFNTAHVQRELCLLTDRAELGRVLADLAAQGRWPQIRRIRGLMHKETSHDWLWKINHVEGSVLAEPDFIINLQKRLGASIIECEACCRRCGAPLDAELCHSEVCATAAATRGHYAVVHALADGLRLADPSLTTEAPGLTLTSLRPADILTTAALPGRSAALDVMVTSPENCAAGDDARTAAFRGKLRKYARILEELRQAGIAFRPMIWTSDGVPHPAVVRSLQVAADKASRRMGADAKSGLLKRWKHEITIAILRRRAAMVRECLPRLGARELRILEGPSPVQMEAPSGRRGGGQLPPLPVDEEE